MTKVDQLSERPAAKTAVLRSLARCHKRPSVTKQLSWHDTLDCRRLSGTPLDVLTTSVRIPKRLHKLHIPSQSYISRHPAGICLQQQYRANT